jgi:hypothetical protein
MDNPNPNPNRNLNLSHSPKTNLQRSPRPLWQLERRNSAPQAKRWPQAFS